MFRLSGSWGERLVLLFCKALVMTKKRKDGSMQIKQVIVVSFRSLSTFNYKIQGHDSVSKMNLFPVSYMANTTRFIFFRLGIGEGANVIFKQVSHTIR